MKAEEESSLLSLGMIVVKIETLKRELDVKAREHIKKYGIDSVNDN